MSKFVQDVREQLLIGKVTETIKKSYKDKQTPELEDETSTFIPLFVLEVGKLEFWIKWFNAKDLKNLRKKEEYLDRTTLGRAIDNFERCSKFKDAKDYRIKKLLSETYKYSFIDACRKVNNLRNNLYHNLSSKDFKSLLIVIKSRIELSNTINYVPCEINRKVLYASPRRGLLQGEQLSSYWTIDMLYYILMRYYIPNKL